MSGLHGMLRVLNSLLFLITDYTQPNGSFLSFNHQLVCEYAAFPLRLANASELYLPHPLLICFFPFPPPFLIIMLTKTTEHSL